jgi:anti-sigma regulatory factor (Ser/Thr protein kinase)
MKSTLSLRGAAHVLPRLRSWTAGVWRVVFCGHDPDGRRRLVLAVHEAARNIIEHAYAERAGYIDVEAFLEGRALVVELWHDGVPIDRDAVSDPIFDGSRESGLGCFLIEQAVDHVLYQTDARGRHCVRLELALAANRRSEEEPC